MSAKVLVVDDDKNFLNALRENARLRKEKDKIELETFDDPRIALQYFRENGADVVVTDVLMDGMDGMQLFNTIMNIDKSAPVIIISAYATVQKAVDAVAAGACHYFEKPIDPEEFWKKIKEAIHSRQFKRMESISDRAFEFAGALAHVQSEARKRILRQIDKAKNTPTTALITGERGSGKGLAAKAIHNAGDRKDQPFVLFPCDSIPESGPEENLMESLIAQAEGGTLYLEEISSLPMRAQADLLQTLRKRSSGSSKDSMPHTNGPRIIASSSRDLDRELEEGRLNKDLYWHINVFKLYIPPLRETPEDISPLSKYFLNVHKRKLNRTVDIISYDAMTSLKAYSWPGNIRELENVIESAMVTCEEGIIHNRDLPFIDDDHNKGNPLIPSLKEAERNAIVSALQYADGQIKQAARMLGIHRNTLTSKMKELGITEKAWNLEDTE